MKLLASPLIFVALLPASRNRSWHCSISCTSICCAPLHRATMLDGASSCSAYRRLMRVPASATLSSAASVIESPSVVTRIRRIRFTSSASYACVGMMRRRARRSGGMPCAATMSSVPRMVHMPRFEARMTTGDMRDSRARLR